jgi:branched-chain amino acid transport system ATP-binding protein
LATDGNILELSDIVAGYGGGTVLHGLSMSVARGRLTTVIGPNGAGKSTVFKVVFGLLRAREGEVRFDGTVVNRLSQRALLDLGIVYVPQGRNLFPELSALHNLELGGAALLPRRQLLQRMEEAMTHFPVIRRKAGQQASTLSGGEQKMLEIARALLLEPKLLMIDEPSIGLAPLLAAQVFDELVRLRDQGVTVLMIEQNARSALARSDDAVVLEQGRTALAAPAADVLADPRVGRLFLGAGLDG